MIAYSEAVGQLQANQAIFRFFKKMIAFRKLRPSLCRSRFWRDDIRWYGTGPVVDLSPDSRTLAFCLHGGEHRTNPIRVDTRSGRRRMTTSM